MLFIPAERFVPADAAGAPYTMPADVRLSRCGCYLGVTGFAGYGTHLIDLHAGNAVGSWPWNFGSLYFHGAAGTTLIGRVGPNHCVQIAPERAATERNTGAPSAGFVACPHPLSAGREIGAPTTGNWCRGPAGGVAGWKPIPTPPHCQGPTWLRADSFRVVGGTTIGQFFVLECRRTHAEVEMLFYAPTDILAFDLAAGVVAYVTHNHVVGVHRVGADPAGDPGRQFFPPGRPAVTALSLSPDGRRLALGHGRKGLVSILDLERPNKAVAVYDWKVGEVGALCHSPDGTQLAAAGVRGVAVWDLV